jgi:two-component system sensor histidine kinase KdpD
VFEPFYRAGTAAGGHRGSGLGLAIARGFTEANAGSLHVESLPGQGATFVFDLPLRETGEGREDGAIPNAGPPADGADRVAPPGGWEPVA